MTAEWGEMPSHWSIYVLVPDVDACATRAVEHGGKICVLLRARPPTWGAALPDPRTEAGRLDEIG